MARKKALTDPEQVARRRLVRRLIVENMTTGEIVALLVAGAANPKTGTLLAARVSESTARRDVAAVEEELAALFSTEEAADAEIGACYELYKKISVAASSGPKPQYHAAITATDRRIRIAASRSSRWRHLAGPLGAAAPMGSLPEADAEAAARLAELAAMDDDGLIARHRQLVERANLLGLEVLDGGALAAKRTG